MAEKSKIPAPKKNAKVTTKSDELRAMREARYEAQQKAKPKDQKREGVRMTSVKPGDMPDDCHDHCAPAGRTALYYPYHWKNGTAQYECDWGHQWTCWWGVGHGERGSALEHKGVAVEIYTDGTLNIDGTLKTRDEA